MRVIGLASRTVHWTLAPRGAARDRTTRAALLVELRTADHVGLGEAAPLPGMSRDTLAEAAAAIAAFAPCLPLTVDSAADVFALTADVPSPSARFALETALLDLVARAHHISIAQLLSRIPHPAPTLASAVVVDDVPAALAAVAAGARCLKLKIAPDHLDHVRAIATAVAAMSGITLRLDANQSFPRANVQALLASLADLPIELVEEPCPDTLALILANADLALLLALDESLAALEPAQLLALTASPGPLGALVLKPTLLGGFHACLALARRAQLARLPVIITHALEGPVGTAACAELARALGDAVNFDNFEQPPASVTAGDRSTRSGTLSTSTTSPPVAPGAPGPTVGTLSINSTSPPCGLAPHAALDAWSIDVPQLAGATVRASDHPGTGLAPLDLATLVAACRESPGDRIDEVTALAGPELAVADPACLSITGAAREVPDGLAVITAREQLTFADCATRAMADASRARLATPEVATLLAIYAKLDAARPIGLVHAKASAAEQARQGAVLESAALPAGTACVLFTSGSTGVPRGVVLSRAGLAAAAAANTAHLGWRDDDRWLLALSLAHAGGLAVAVRCLAARKPVVLAAETDALATLLVEHRVTLASLVPTQLAALLDDPRWRPAAHLRAVLLGGAAAPASLLAAAAARDVPVLVTYGMTETFGQIATAPPTRAGDPTAPLVPLPGVTLVAGTRAHPAPIRIRAPMRALRYLDAPLDDVLGTRDLGYLATGALHILGRTDDVIITGGENVHPATVEAVLLATPGVRAACAFGVPDLRWGQLVGAALAITAAFDRTTALAAWHAALPSHARPRRLALVETLPLLPTGKLDRRAAADLPAAPIDYA